MNAPPAIDARTNWAGNLQYRAPHLLEPSSVTEAQEWVARTPHLRPLGSRHSFTRIADGRHAQLSLRNLPRVVQVDEERRTVTIDGGARYGDLCTTLDQHGFALPNLASLPHISVAGAIATATHGSGAEHRNLAAAVSALQFLTAEGELLSVSRERDGDAFAGSVVHLGALGPVVALTLDLVPRFEVRQHVYLDLPQAALRSDLHEILRSAYSVSLFTDYRGGRVKQVWCKHLADESSPTPDPDFFGARPATQKVHPLDTDPAACTDQLGIAGPWYERLPHFRMGHTPSGGEEIQAEYYLPREHATDAYDALTDIADAIAPHLLISEIRLIAADELWMSPAYQRDLVAFHFTLRRDRDSVKGLLPKVEAALRPFGPVPHWGKVSCLPPREVRSRYPRLADFRDLVATHDPAGKFRNDYLRAYLDGADDVTPNDLW